MPDPQPESPRLSVIVPAWNAASTIETAVRSVTSQDDVPLECVVVDDGSTDDTWSIVESLARQDPRVIAVRSTANQGPAGARNLGLDHARGTWLAFLDADDRLLPGGLGAMLRAADATEARVVVGQRISTDGERTWFPTLYDLPDIRRPGVKSIAANPGLLYYAGPVGKLFHRACAEGLRFEGRVIEDQPWVLRAMLRAGDRITVIEDVVYEWRRPHPDRYVPTITAERERSAARAAEAVAMSGVAFRIVGDEIDRLVAPDQRLPLRATYLDRLIKADLGHPLNAAVERADPDLPILFHAMGELLAAVPPDVLRKAAPVVARVLVPPLDRWGRLDRRARSAYWAMVRPWLHGARADARRLRRGVNATRGLRLVAHWDNALTRAVASAILSRTER